MSENAIEDTDLARPIARRTRRARWSDQIIDKKAAARQHDMIAAGLAGIAPKDALEEMVAAQMLAVMTPRWKASNTHRTTT